MQSLIDKRRQIAATLSRKLKTVLDVMITLAHRIIRFADENDLEVKEQEKKKSRASSPAPKIVSTLLSPQSLDLILMAG